MGWIDELMVWWVARSVVWHALGTRPGEFYKALAPQSVVKHQRNSFLLHKITGFSTCVSQNAIKPTVWALFRSLVFIFLQEPLEPFNESKQSIESMNRFKEWNQGIGSMNRKKWLPGWNLACESQCYSYQTNVHKILDRFHTWCAHGHRDDVGCNLHIRTASWD